MLRLTLLVSLSLLCVSPARALDGEAPEALTKLDFAVPRFWVYVDDHNTPGDRLTKLSADAVDRNKGKILGWHAKSRSLLIDFGQGTKGWVKVSDLVPESGVCSKPQPKPLPFSPNKGGNIEVATTASRGFADKACAP